MHIRSSPPHNFVPNSVCKALAPAFTRIPRAALRSPETNRPVDRRPEARTINLGRKLSRHQPRDKGRLGSIFNRHCLPLPRAASFRVRPRGKVKQRGRGPRSPRGDSPPPRRRLCPDARAIDMHRRAGAADFDSEAPGALCARRGLPDESRLAPGRDRAHAHKGRGCAPGRDFDFPYFGGLCPPCVPTVAGRTIGGCNLGARIVPDGSSAVSWAGARFTHGWFGALLGPKAWVVVAMLCTCGTCFLKADSRSVHVGLASVWCTLYCLCDCEI